MLLLNTIKEGVREISKKFCALTKCKSVVSPCGLKKKVEFLTT
tara:strand:- start:313 stop:441 length:129 start_codon:yes stop_codon:yes gene_type:complete